MNIYILYIYMYIYIYIYINSLYIYIYLCHIQSEGVVLLIRGRCVTFVIKFT